MFNDWYDHSYILELTAESEIDINTPFFGNSGAKIPTDNKDKIIAKQEEIRKHLGKYDYNRQCNKCRELFDELKQLESELNDLKK